MTTPFLINKPCFQEVWKEAVTLLATNQWKYYNLVVQITDPTALNDDTHELVSGFLKGIGKLPPKDVAYTIFPYTLYKEGNATELYCDYLRKIYPWTRKKPHSNWGTYFERMINYIDKSGNGRVNQLDNIIQAINSRNNTATAAYTITITYPGGETTRPIGAPCLNYITIQLLPGNPVKMGLMAIYRNHDFVERAYGNYFGLCKLLHFLNTETGTSPGYITCISSHAFVDSNRADLRNFINQM